MVICNRNQVITIKNLIEFISFILLMYDIRVNIHKENVITAEVQKLMAQ